jgi:hypothetical protein
LVSARRENLFSIKEWLQQAGHLRPGGGVEFAPELRAGVAVTTVDSSVRRGEPRQQCAAFHGTKAGEPIDLDLGVGVAFRERCDGVTQRGHRVGVLAIGQEHRSSL